jgi:excinuclease ABC subunit A
LQLTFEEAAEFFDFHSQLSQVCRLMIDCGLGYLTLGQSSPTLSGGEAQRLKLVTELATGLASDDSSYMTGSALVVDGGITAAYVTPEE